MKTLPHAEWLAWRNQGIGSSDAAAVMGASPWCTPFELWARRTGRLPQQPQNAAMRRGLQLEPVARAEYERLTGIPMPACRRENAERPFIRATFDGLNRDAKRVLEIKCPGREDHHTAAKGSIPDKYLWQCVHLMLVADLPVLDYFSYDGRTSVTITLKRSEMLEKRLIEKEIEFWNYILTDTAPPQPEKAKSFAPAPNGLNIFRMRRSR